MIQSPKRTLRARPARNFISFNGKRAVRLDLPSAALHYYFSDHLGSANVVTSATGTIQDESDYYSFGGERLITNTDPNQYKFTGKERDPESGLDDFGARFYNSSLSRFMSPDEVLNDADLTDPQSFNLYMYSRNNPLLFYRRIRRRDQVCARSKKMRRQCVTL